LIYSYGIFPVLKYLYIYLFPMYFLFKIINFMSIA
jgi:hypothetical protein